MKPLIQLHVPEINTAWMSIPNALRNKALNEHFH